MHPLQLLRMGQGAAWGAAEAADVFQPLSSCWKRQQGQTSKRPGWVGRKSRLRAPRQGAKDAGPGPRTKDRGLKMQDLGPRRRQEVVHGTPFLSRPGEPMQSRKA